MGTFDKSGDWHGTTELTSSELTAGTFKKENPISGPLAQDSNEFDRYVRRSHKAEYMEDERARELARAWRTHQDYDARNQLIESHLRMATSAARRYVSHDRSQDDLTSVATIGLFKAADRYDPDHPSKASFATFAAADIKAELKEYTLDHYFPVRCIKTKGTRKAFFNYYETRNAVGVLPDKQMNTAQIEQATALLNSGSSARTQVTTEDVRFVDIARQGGMIRREIESSSESDDFPSLLDSIACKAPGPEKTLEARQLLGRALDAFNQLNPREQDILTRRRLDENPATLHELADQYNVSAERVRQIENNAAQKIARALVGSGNELDAYEDEYKIKPTLTAAARSAMQAKAQAQRAIETAAKPDIAKPAVSAGPDAPKPQLKRWPKPKAHAAAKPVQPA